jgi:hypothetical protein
MPVRIVPLEDAVPAFEVSLAWSARPLTAAAQGLVDLLRTELLPQPLLE